MLWTELRSSSTLTLHQPSRALTEPTWLLPAFHLTWMMNNQQMLNCQLQQQQAPMTAIEPTGDREGGGSPREDTDCIIYLEYSLDRHGLPRAFFYIWLNRSTDALRKLSQIIQWTFKPHTLCPVFLTSTDHPCHLPKWYRYQSRLKRKTTPLIVWDIYLDLQYLHFVTPLRTESDLRTEKNVLGSWVSLDCQPGRLNVSPARMSHAASLTWP